MLDIGVIHSALLRTGFWGFLGEFSSFFDDF
jgi:hypothetical protein